MRADDGGLDHLDSGIMGSASASMEEIEPDRGTARTPDDQQPFLGGCRIMSRLLSMLILEPGLG
jgi:hypothetical protein